MALERPVLRFERVCNWPFLNTSFTSSIGELWGVSLKLIVWITVVLMAKITVLKSRGIPLCKRFEREIKHPYPSKVKQFFADVRQATNIHELSKLLCQLEQNEPTACVIRGGLADGVDTNRPILRRLRRSNENHRNSLSGSSSFMFSGTRKERDLQRRRTTRSLWTVLQKRSRSEHQQ